MGNLLYLGIVLLIVAIVLYALGAKGVAGMTAGVGKLLLVVGVVLFLILLVVQLVS